MIFFLLLFLHPCILIWQRASEKKVDPQTVVYSVCWSDVFRKLSSIGGGEYKGCREWVALGTRTSSAGRAHSGRASRGEEESIGRRARSL